MSRARLLALVLASLLTAGQAPVFAAPPPDATAEARRFFRRGVEFFGEKNYEAAMVEFRRAYEIAPSESILYNIGQIQYLTNDHAAALATFRKYLRDGGAKIPAARRAQVERDVERLQQLVASVELSTNATDADVAVDDVVIDHLPLSGAITVNAGRRRVALRKGGRDLAAEQLDVAAGDHAKLTLSIDTQAPAPTPPLPAPTASVAPSAPVSGPAEPTPQPEAPKSSRSALPVVLWIGTGALVAATTVTGILALGASRDLRNARYTDGETRESLDAARDKTKNLALATDILGATTAVALGVALYVTLATRASTAAPVRVGIGAGHVVVLGDF